MSAGGDTHQIDIDQSLVARFLYDHLVTKNVIESIHMDSLQYDGGEFWISQVISQISGSPRHVNRDSVRVAAGVGVGHRPEASLVVAGAESLERLCGFAAYQRLDIVKARECDFVNSAIGPLGFALGSPAEYAKLAEFLPYSRDEMIQWVRAIDLTEEDRVYVPAVFACMSIDRLRSEQFSSPVNSSGIAAGPSQDSARLSALCELVERDALMIFHLNRLPLSEIVPDEYLSAASLGLLSDFGTRQGADVRFWNMTLDIPIPIVLATAVSTDRGTPSFVCSAACKPNPANAVNKALYELVQSWMWIEDEVAKDESGHSGEQIPGDSVIREHALYYARRGGADMMNWLLRQPNVGNDSSRRVLPNQERSSVNDTLRHCVELINGAGYWVGAVDLTLEEIRRFGLNVQRVIVPGLQPLHFGRFRGLGGRRIYEVPVRSGYRASAHRESDLNGHPHPFA